MIVPVRMYHQDNLERQVVIYALLDPASNGTFVKESILEELQVNGVETQLKLNTMHGSEVVPTRRVSGLIVERMDRAVYIKLPKTYSRNEIPSRRNEIPRPESAAKWPHLSHLANKIYPYQNDLQVGLLIGSNCPNAIKPKQVIPGRSSDPYAIRTLLGWGIIGPVTGSTTTEDSDVLCHRVAVKEIGSEELPSHSFVVETHVKEIISPEAVKRMFERDFNEGKHAAQQTLSMDDRRFMAKVKEGITHRSDGHYELPLPLRNESLALPNNEKLAVHRLQQLKLRFRRDEKYKEDYTAFMNDMIKKGYAEKIPKDEVRKDGKTWYLPHHGVFHPQKPDKIRVVFDCSAEYKGEALNKHLLQGPDLTNKLVGVLSRFRREPVAFMADIEAMFLQVHVTEHCRDLLRFLWWEDGDVNKEPTIYRMTVHLFGAGSSPGCCNFALKKTADDHEQEFGLEPAEFLRKDFYVDDGLKSVPSTSQAKELIRKTKEMCRRGGFNLHKFTSNKREVIESIPVEDRAKGIKELNLEKDELPMERALGVSWCIESDAFKFQIVMQDRPLTRRGILSTVSSVYDPLGFLAPLILTGKGLLQDLCRGKVEWDDPIPENIRSRWLKWRDELRHLEDLSVRRCFKPEGFGTVISTQLHHFSDASTTGYGQCSYVRLVDDKGQIHCSLIMGKARVAPLKMVTIPRLELTAAVVSVRVSEMLRQELQYESVEEIFWTDSKVVLGYIKNGSKRFHVFVANRVQQIRTIRSVLSALLEKSASCLDGESFHTLICETEAIVNSRPLTVDNRDPGSLSPLTPNHILTMKAKPVLPPPGVFQREDLYSRKRWRRVQHLSCEFWDRWRKEFLHSLQERSKWTRPRRNMQVGDVVIVKDDNKARNRWSLARVIETYPNKADGLVRSVKVAIGDPDISSTGKRVHPPSVLERPIQKLVLLLPREERLGFPHGEPFNEHIQKED